MSLPQSYSSSILYDLDDFQPHFVSKLHAEPGIEQKDESLIFNNEIFFIPFTTTFSIDIHNEKVKIPYEIDAIPLIKLITALLLFAGLFSSFTASFFFYYGAIASLLIYIFGLLFVRSQFFGIIKKYHVNIEETLSSEQMQWISNPNKCSACGDELLQYQSKCHSCGLQSRPPKRFSPFSTTLPKVNMTYKYMDEEE